MSEYPALSRRDNKTDICSKCGTEEAMFDFAMSQKSFAPVGVGTHQREALFKQYLAKQK